MKQESNGEIVEAYYNFIGKKELVTIITLGSAAGDPMFYKKVGVLPAILVFVSIIAMYRIINFFVTKSKSFEHFVEGHHLRLVYENRFAPESFKKAELGKDEIHSDLRLCGVAHLGQAHIAYIEASGKLSVFFLPDDKVNYGLPLLPEAFENQLTEISEAGIYSCGFCGFTIEIAATKHHQCMVCNRNKWVKSVNDLRVN